MACNRFLGLCDLGFIQLTQKIYKVARVKLTRLAITSVACMYLPEFSFATIKIIIIKMSHLN